MSETKSVHSEHQVQNDVILSFMGATCFKRVGTGQQEAKRLSGTKKKHLEEQFKMNCVNQQQVSNMTAFKKSILERQKFSEVKTGRGSPF